jgi:protein SCO1
MFRYLRLLTVLATILPLLAAGLQAQELMGSAAPPRGVGDVGIDQKLNEQVPLDLQFRDESGRTVTLGEYFHKRPVVLALVYYECPMLCTLILNGMLSAFRTLAFNPGEEFEIVTVSIDPRETPELAADKKAEYLAGYGRPGAEQGWHFLTGEEHNIRQLADAVGFRYFYDPQTQEYGHASAIMVATPSGRLARYFYGIEYSARDLRLSLVEASNNRIGSPVDQILLYCFHYDPMTGKYGLVIRNLLRLGGALTLLMIGGFVTVMLMRDRSRGRMKEQAARQATDGH